MKFLQLTRRALRRSWMKYALRGVGGADRYARLDLAYRIADPWNMESKLEKTRFERTNALIERHFPRPRSILEIGCGEGHQSEHLQRLCDELYGVDVSETAVSRASLRLPKSRFAAGDIFSQPWGSHSQRFDLVVACEVLYYIADIPRTIAEMSRLGRSCLVTVYAPALARVGPALEAVLDVRKDWFAEAGTQWAVAFWHNSSPSTAPLGTAAAEG